MPNGPALQEDYFSTFLVEIVADPETMFLAPFTDGLEFISLTEITPLPQNPRGDQLVLVTGTGGELGQLSSKPGVQRVGVGLARTFLVGETKNRGWATADLPSKWKRKT